ncbi:MAG: hypothetical protein WC612_02135 [Bdellovibrionales bacterium]|jgi:hypothetical protein
MEQTIAAAALAVFISFFTNAIYIRDTLRGKTKPHLFSWLVWALVMGIGAAIAFSEGAYMGALAIGNGSLWCFVISLLALRHGEKRITLSDWVMFLSALSIIPFWFFTKEPLLAAFLAASIDFFGFMPTFRKAWHKPLEENLKAFSLYVSISIFRVLSIDPYSWTTGLYPTAVLVMETSMVIMLFFRRRALSPARAIG